MNRDKSWHARLSSPHRNTLRSRLVASFLLLGVLPSLLIGYAGYLIGAQLLIQNTIDNMGSALRQNVHTTDVTFDIMKDAAFSVSIDEDLFGILSQGEPALKSELLSNSRKVAAIMRRYFPGSLPIYSANIVIDYYTYSLFNQNMPFLNEAFYNSPPYQEAVKGSGNLQWVPTYDYPDSLGMKSLQDADVDYRYLFSAVRIFNAMTVPLISGGYSKYPSTMKSPVLVLNFKPEIFKERFADILHYKGAQFYVLTDRDEIVASSDSSLTTATFDSSWLDHPLSEGVFRLKGEAMIVCREVMSSTGWTVLEIVPVKNIIGELSLFQRMSLYFALFLLLLSVTAAIILSARITRPLYVLLEGIDRTGEGNFDILVPIGGFHEIALLAHRFNGMNERIRRLIDENYIQLIKEREAEIIALNFQLNPHFLYNTLGTINWMAIENNQPDIGHMLMALSDMLRYTSKGRQGVVEFSEDLKWLENYIMIMSSRFEGRFETKIEIDPDLLPAMVPKLFLQPFVENAILHGFENMESGGLLQLKGSIQNQTGIFEVTDNGQGMSPEKCGSVLSGDEGHVGTHNIIKRIQLLYGAAGSVEMQSAIGQGVQVRIRIPLR